MYIAQCLKGRKKGEKRRGRGKKRREGCTSSNPISASLMQLLTINHTTSYIEIQHLRART